MCTSTRAGIVGLQPEIVAPFDAISVHGRLFPEALESQRRHYAVVENLGYKSLTQVTLCTSVVAASGEENRASAVYDQVGPKTVSRFGKRLVEMMGIQAGDCVLDVGVGRGANLIPAAERVGVEGSVVGIDISQGMFGDLLKALRGFRRVLKMNGSVGVSMYGGGDPRWAWYGELLGEYGEKHVKFTSFGGNNVNGKPDVLHEALLDAGFEDVRIVIEPFEIVYTSAEEWWQEKWTHGSRAPLEQMTPDLRARFKTEALAKLAEMDEDGVYRMEWKTCFAIAQKGKHRE
jgi:SAM-dependent methyltransferase